ncbi:MAG: RHS repeat-associated core domain-containing protein [Oxalobacteraceae bacterium]|nr:MAG: RHS repeat-associated core domain-containing protein [Oxalobacteraceae bacterium]
MARRTLRVGRYRSDRRGGHCQPAALPGPYEGPETGLLYNRHRYYDPIVARYTSPDPIGLEGGMNGHAYVPDPLSWIDPFGLACAFVDNQGTLNIRNKYPAGSAEDLALRQHVNDWNGS